MNSPIAIRVPLTPLITNPLKFLRLQLLESRQLYYIVRRSDFNFVNSSYSKFSFPTDAYLQQSLQFTYCMLVVLPPRCGRSSLESSYTLYILTGPSIPYRSLYMKEMRFSSITKLFFSSWLNLLFERSSRAFMNLYREWLTIRSEGTRNNTYCPIIVFIRLSSAPCSRQNSYFCELKLEIIIPHSKLS